MTKRYKNISPYKSDSKKIDLLLDEVTNKTFILFDDEFSKELESNVKKYRNIKLRKVLDKETNKEFSLIESEFNNELFNILNSFEDITINEIFDTISIIFETKKQVNYLKFRGDFGEALFLHLIGGEKAPLDSAPFDIILNNEQIEVKTYSSKHKLITVSSEQLKQNIDIYVVPLIPSNKNCVSIIDIANNLRPSYFKTYLIDTYKNTSYEKIRYELVIPRVLINKDKIKFSLSKEIKNADFKIDIDLLENETGE